MLDAVRILELANKAYFCMLSSLLPKRVKLRTAPAKDRMHSQKEFSGFLRAAAYAGYDEPYKVPARDVTEVACWALARRRLLRSAVFRLEVLDSHAGHIRLLCDVEREDRDMKLNGERRLALRLTKSVRILDDINAYLERKRPKPKSPERQAIAYTLSNWKALTRSCEYADLAIDNNGAERSLCGIAVHVDYNFSSTYSESSIMRSATCSAGKPAKFLSTNSLT
jgi:hypothetical protein